MKRNIKAQSAVEYLQTYGWAILVVLIVGVAIWQMGILNIQRANTASGFSVVKVLEPTIQYREDDINFTVMNAGGIRIRVTETIATSGDCSIIWLDPGHIVESVMSQELCESMGGIWNYDECWRFDVVSMDPGEKKSIGRWNCDELHPGEQFEIHLTFKYDERIGIGWVSHSDKGIIRGYAE